MKDPDVLSVADTAFHLAPFGLAEPWRTHMSFFVNTARVRLRAFQHAWTEKASLPDLEKIT